MRFLIRKRLKVPAIVLGAFLFALPASRPLMAQSQPVTGTVVDPAARAVPGATVTITDVNKGQVVKTTTSGCQWPIQRTGHSAGSLQVAD